MAATTLEQATEESIAMDRAYLNGTFRDWMAAQRAEVMAEYQAEAEPPPSAESAKTTESAP